MRKARTVGQSSKCSSRQIGVVIVQDGSVVSEGYNGAPRGSSLCQKGPEGTCRRRGMGFASGEGLEECPAVHAEQNALLQAARNGVCVRGATMYAHCCRPCKACAGSIINAGIARLVYLDLPCYDELSGTLLAESNVEITTVLESEL